MWGKTAAVSSPASRVGFSGASAAEGAAEKDSPPSDTLVWAPPKTPFRSPLRMEEEFESLFPSEELPRSPPTPSATFPAVFLEPSSPTEYLVKPQATSRDSGPSARSYRSLGSSFEAYSYSSEDGAPRDHRRWRDRSRRRRSRSSSRSRSRHMSRRSISPRRMFRRSVSPEEEWVRVSIPRSQLFGAAAVPDTSGWLPRSRSLVGFFSSRKYDRRRDSSHQAPGDTHESAKVPTPSTQLRESSLRSGSRVLASKSTMHHPEREKTPFLDGQARRPLVRRKKGYIQDRGLRSSGDARPTS
ncbi:arginine/serine-rich protein 1-like [Palaemon carinicauda]|uniref:arginine/serine-rich protein 1-like n=1 Tax=Palaemon carinicauda TaxID=392227 RepID=UPI0035B62C91